jgi:hypothetical protein
MFLVALLMVGVMGRMDMVKREPDSINIGGFIEYKNKFITAVEEAADDIVYDLALQREGAPASKTIGDVAAQLDLSWDEIMEAKNRLEID